MFETIQSKNYSPSYLKTHKLQKAEIIKNKLVFEPGNNFSQALKDGFFLVKIPHDLDLAPADKFARNFYKSKSSENIEDNKYRGYNLITSSNFGDTLLGFHERKYQIEQFLLEKRFWQEYYPAELTILGNKICQLSTDIIASVLDEIGIPPKYWDQATGGCVNNAGSYHFTFNHFRPQMDTLGLQAHEDDGFITILRSIQPGLEILLNNEWVKLPAEPNYFKINFGLTMQILTKHLAQPVSAVTHRVVQQKQEPHEEHRWSWGHFSSSNFRVYSDRGIYTYKPDEDLIYHSGAREHIDKNDSEIYK